jgi:hypothetical protein
MKPMSNKLIVAVLALTVAGWIAGSDSLSGQDGKKKAKGRLPAYYADLVSDTQKTQIYAIQEKYAQQIAALMEQLEALNDKRDAEIEAVLNADQRAKLKQAQQEGAAKRKKATADKKAAKDAASTETSKAAARKAQ